MSKITGNEPAMPVDRDKINMNCTGLTIRQHFAAMAMQGLCATDMIRDRSLHRQLGDEDLSARAVAVTAIAVADALIDELNQTEK